MSAPTASVFSSSNVPAAPPDALFGLVKQFKEDPSDKKVSLVIGAYRDDNNQPWLLPSVIKVFSFYYLLLHSSIASLMMMIKGP